MFLSIVLLLSIKSLFADAIPLCSLPDRLVTASTLTACLKSIPIDQSELEKFVSTVIEYVKNSPYPLLFMGGPNNLAPFDVLGELETLKSGAATWTGTVLGFYEKIHDIIDKLKDPHATVYFPFLRSFLYFLPYGFAPVSENENSLKLTANEITGDYVSGGTDYTGSIIEKIDYSGSTYKLAAVAFSEFALEVGSAGHDPHALYNAVMKKGNGFSALELFRPEERYNPDVKLKGKDGNGDPIEITIPWLGYFSGSSTTNSFDDLNPPVPSSSGRIKNGEKHIGRDSVEHFLPHVLHNQIPPIFVERERMMEKIKQQLGVSTDLSAKKYEPRLITSMYEKMLAARGLKPSPSPSPSRSPFRSPVDVSMLHAIDLDAVSLEKLYEYTPVASTCTIYADAVNKIGYIRYKGFTQGDGDLDAIANFFSAFGDGYKSMVDKGVTDVIFDVRGNGGGTVLILEEFTDFFFHDSISPPDLDTDVLLGEHGTNLFAGGNYFELTKEKLTGVSPFYKFDEDGEKTIITDMLSSQVEKTHDNKVAGPSTFKANYTQRAFFTQRLNTSISDAYGGYSPFDPEHFYIVSDGVCGSCCGIFTKLAVESKAARVLGYGVNPTKKDDISTYVPGNCAGTLYGTNEVETIRQVFESLSDEALGLSPGSLDVYLSFLPPKFERQDVSFGVSNYEFFSRNPAHADQTLYMVPATVEGVLPLQVSSEPETDAVLKEIVAVTKNLYIGEENSGSTTFVSVPALLLALIFAMLVFW